jgi:hypothetical protein
MAQLLTPRTPFGTGISVADDGTKTPVYNTPFGELINDLNSADILSLMLNLKAPAKKDIKILSVSGITFAERSQDTSGNNSAYNQLTEIVDTTTYPDRAILTLYNGRGYNVYLTEATLNGFRTIQYSGEAGELIHDSLKRDDDIRRNGETVFEIGNEYIVDGTQCAKIADYWYKALGKKKHMYALSIPGSCPWYSVGDWYNLKVGEADTNEYIDTVVECFAVDVERSAGDIGSTTLILRDVEDNWAKTTLYETRIATGGSPKRRVNRSNIVTVASSEYDGTYDYKCDGVDDDVQIQAAIDYVSNTFGGGTVQLTNGAMIASATITMKSNVILRGVGNSTALKPKNSSVKTLIDFTTATGAIVSDLKVDGDGSNITFDTAGTSAINNMYIIDGKNIGTLKNISITNYSLQGTNGVTFFYIFYRALDISSCTVDGNKVGNSGTASSLVGFLSCDNITMCSTSSNTSSDTNSPIYGFQNCTNLSACSVIGNSTAGAGGLILAFYICNNVSSCSLKDNETSGSNAHIQGFTSCENMAACSSSDNITDSSNIYSFVACKRISVCSTLSNTTISGTKQGYLDCRSVQQCKSSGDSTSYVTSYADSGTANACADTSDGGYNS